MLYVCYEERIIGHLMLEEDVLSFEYAQSWLASADSFSLSPHLPLAAPAYRGNSVIFFFSNLLPEGNILSTILKLKRLPEGNLYAQLKILGEEVSGAFSIVSSHTEALKTPKYKLYSEAEIKKDLSSLKQHIPLLAQHQKLRLSLAGAQNKIPIKFEEGKFWLSVNGAASTHILKPAIQPSYLFSDSVWNEALCLRLASYCGLHTISFDVTFFSDEPVLLIDRYDRLREGEKIKRLHQLDFCQLTERLPDQKYEKEGGISLVVIMDAIERYTGKPALNKLKVIDWVLFNYLVGNADAHAKNLSILILPNNKTELTPFYDILCTAIYEKLDKKMAMAIGGEYRPDWVLQENWHKFAESLSINITLLRDRANKLAEKISQKYSLAFQSLGLDENAPIVKKIGNVINKRKRLLKSRLI
jgi:serine/threonine-protein kinase HipA